MYRKNYISLSLALFVFLAGGLGAFAQDKPVKGKVELQKADGTKAPGADALVESYRTDIATGVGPTTKTDARGEFNLAGLPQGQTFVLAVSGPGISPRIQPNVKAGQANIVIVVDEGDGQKAPEADVRIAAAAPPRTAATAEEIKKQQAEQQKQKAEIEARNKKAGDTNKIVNAVLKEGSDAYNAKNYDLAIAKFDEGYSADPDFEGSAPILLSNKGLALRERGVAAVVQSSSGDAAAKAAAREKAKADFTAAIIAFEKGLEVLKKAPPGDAKAQAGMARDKASILSNYVILHGLMARLQVDAAKMQEPIPVLDQYLAVETDPKKKITTVNNWAGYMNGAGEAKNAVHAYRLVLKESPEDIDAIAGIGLSLFSAGEMADPKDKAQIQEGLNYMQKFVDTAPETHALKASIKETIENIKAEQNIKPQAPAKAPAKKKT
ncbi:MAG: carboxypeptidase-like regulatory domain-containing protein [Pyrinomonadaceae bacterium]